MSLKKAAEDLLKIADDIETEAAGVTQFVCDKCNHTATLAKINAARTASAKEAGENVTVSEITVNDQVMCPACDGVMSYKATDESSAYYYDEKKAEEKDPEEEKKPKEAAKPTPEEIAEEKKETPEQQALEEQGKKLHKEPHPKEASIDYDALDMYVKG